jgi:membrane fusion protein, multidrug efflux system
MFGRLLIPAGQRRHLCLTTAAIQEVGQLQFVEVVRGDQTLDRRMIRVGRLGMPGRVEVLSGLRAGERVVCRDDSTAAPTAAPTAVPGTLPAESGEVRP